MHGSSRADEAQRTLALRFQTTLADSFSEQLVPVAKDSEVSEEQLASRDLVLLGGPRDNALVARLFAALGEPAPAQLGDGSFRFQGRTHGAAEKPVVQLDPQTTSLPAIRRAVESAGYSVPDESIAPERPSRLSAMSRPLLPWLTFGLGGLLLLFVVVEALDLVEPISARIPFWIPLGFVVLVGFPIFRNVVRLALRGRVIAHSLMTLGVLAALLVGQWLAAALIVFLMWVGAAIERYTAGTARRAVRSLAELMPQSARLEQEGHGGAAALFAYARELV